jgi:hypothetical protein
MLEREQPMIAWLVTEPAWLHADCGAPDVHHLANSSARVAKFCRDHAIRAYLGIRGGISPVGRHVRKEAIKTLINPSEPKDEEMIEAILTPAHTNALKALLN